MSVHKARGGIYAWTSGRSGWFTAAAEAKLHLWGSTHGDLGLSLNPLGQARLKDKENGKRPDGRTTSWMDALADRFRAPGWTSVPGLPRLPAPSGGGKQEVKGDE